MKLALALLLCSSSALAQTGSSAWRWGAGASLASEQVLRGVAVAPGTTSPGLDLTLHQGGTGWSLGLAANRLERDAAGRRWVFNTSLARRWPLGEDWSLELAATRRHYPGPPARRLVNASEASLQLAWRADWALSLSHVPALGRFIPGQGPRKAPAQALEFSTQRLLPLPWPLALDAGVGVLRWQGLRGSRYAYGHVGVVYEAGTWQASLTRIESGADAGDGVAASRSGGRWVGVVAVGF